MREADYTDTPTSTNEPVVLTEDQIELVQRFVKLRNLRNYGDTQRRGAPGKVQDQIRTEMKRISTAVRALPLEVQIEMEKRKATV